MATSTNDKAIGPASFAHRFTNVNGTKDLMVEIWPPIFEVGRDCWTCSFRIKGFNEEKISTISCDNFVGATMNAAEVVRRYFHDQGEYFDSDIGPPENIFPRRLPIQYGLDFYNRLDHIIRTAIEKEESVLSERRADEID
jgi:hypothetical protein